MMRPILIWVLVSLTVMAQDAGEEATVPCVLELQAPAYPLIAAQARVDGVVLPTFKFGVRENRRSIARRK